MSATMPTPMNAARLAQLIVDRLGDIERILSRLLQLQEAPRKNFLSAGTSPGQGTVGTSTQSATTTNPIVAPNPKRRGLSVQNTSTSGGPNLTLGLGLQTPQAGSGIVLPPGASWDGRLSGMLWIGSVTVIASAPGCTYSWVEAM